MEGDEGDGAIGLSIAGAFGNGRGANQGIDSPSAAPNSIGEATTSGKGAPNTSEMASDFEGGATPSGKDTPFGIIEDPNPPARNPIMDFINELGARIQLYRDRQFEEQFPQGRPTSPAPRGELEEDPQPQAPKPPEIQMATNEDTDADPDATISGDA